LGTLTSLSPFRQEAWMAMIRGPTAQGGIAAGNSVRGVPVAARARVKVSWLDGAPMDGGA